MRNTAALSYITAVFAGLACTNAFSFSCKLGFAALQLQQKHHDNTSCAAGICRISSKTDSSKSSATRRHQHLTQLHARIENEDNDNDKKISNQEESSSPSFNMSSLQQRILEMQNQDTIRTQPLVVLDSMLPRQVLELKVENELLISLVRTQLELQDKPSFGMLGMATLQGTGQRIHLTRGVEVEILSAEFAEDEDNNDSDGSVSLVLRGARRFEIVPNSVSTVEQGWTTAQIRYLDSSSNGNDGGYGTDHEEEELLQSEALAVDKAKELISYGFVNRVDQWIELARKNERQPNQINQLLQDLGDMPGVDQPTELAFWIGALINPLPALGVSMEVRPALLMADTVEERMEIASDAILKSIRHMDGSQRMW